MNGLDTIFEEASKCHLCKDLVSDLGQFKSQIPYPVPNYDQTYGGINSKIIFILESAGISDGGAAQTGILSVEGNYDQTAKNGALLRKASGIDSKYCLFINSILHAAIKINEKTNLPAMRSPKPSEIRNCSGKIKSIIDCVDPLIVAPVGRAALSAISNIEKHVYTKITECAGKPFPWYNRIAFPLVHWSLRGLANRALNLQIADHNNLGLAFSDLIKSYE